MSSLQHKSRSHFLTWLRIWNNFKVGKFPRWDVAKPLKLITFLSYINHLICPSGALPMAFWACSTPMLLRPRLVVHLWETSTMGLVLPPMPNGPMANSWFLHLLELLEICASMLRSGPRRTTPLSLPEQLWSRLSPHLGWQWPCFYAILPIPLWVEGERGG